MTPQIARLTDTDPDPILCAWCPTYVKTDPRHKGVSHGMCASCVARLTQDLPPVPVVVDVAIVPVDPTQVGPVVDVTLIPLRAPDDHPFGAVPPGPLASLPTIDPCGGSARRWWGGLGTRRRYRGNGR